MKTCSKCGEEKELTEFYSLKSKGGKLHCKCIPCEVEYQREYREKNREKILAQKKEYRLLNRDRINAEKRVYIYKNHEKIKAAKRKYQKDNYEKISAKRRTPEYREYENARNKAFREANPELYRERKRAGRIKHADRIKAYKRRHDLKHTRKRQCIKQQRVPSWYNDKKVSVVYEKRVELQNRWGVKLHVDHLYPLQGKTCSGLHTWENLQIIEATENQWKINKHPRDMVAAGWLYQAN